MNKFRFILFLFTASFLFQACKQKEDEKLAVYANFDDFEREIIKTNKPTVINFWATWCKPCVEELPFFIEWYNNQNNKNIELVLVSLDAEENIKEGVIPFLKENNIKVKSVVLTDGKAHKWIDKINPDWSGSIPATLFINNDKKQFAEKEYHSTKELRDEIESFFN